MLVGPHGKTLQDTADTIDLLHISQLLTICPYQYLPKKYSNIEHRLVVSVFGFRYPSTRTQKEILASFQLAKPGATANSSQV